MKFQPTAFEVSRDLAGDQAAMQVRLNAIERDFIRPVLEALAARCIDALDALDALDAEREPDDEDEVISEDDGIVYDLKSVGRQA